MIVLYLGIWVRKVIFILVLYFFSVGGFGSVYKWGLILGWFFEFSRVELDKVFLFYFDFLVLDTGVLRYLFFFFKFFKSVKILVGEDS